MSMGMKLLSGRARIKPRPFFLPKVPQTQHTYDSHCRMSVVFPKEAARAWAPCLRAHRWVGQYQVQGPAVLTPSPRPPLLGRERDCPDRAGDYTANPELRPESMDPSLWGGRRGARWSQRVDSLLIPI